jgi:hypothetical protein
MSGQAGDPDMSLSGVLYNWLMRHWLRMKTTAGAWPADLFLFAAVRMWV